MPGMKISLPGLAKTAARALTTSRDDMACYSAHSVCELVDNLRTLRDGGCTVEEFFEVYVFDSGSAETKLADSVKPENFLCMRDDEECELCDTKLGDGWCSKCADAA